MQAPKALEFSYCPHCGAKTTPTFDYWSCPDCGRHWYLNPKPASEAALYNSKGEILFCRRAKDPGIGMIDLPGGFIEVDETAEQALYRELQEELGLSEDDLENVQYLGTATCDYEYRGAIYKNLVLQYSARIKDGSTPVANDDVAEFFFAKPASLARADFCWPDLHYDFAQTALDKNE